MRPLSALTGPVRIAALASTATVLAVVVSWGALAGAEDVDDLRGDVPTGEDVRDELAAIADERAELLAELAGKESELVVVLGERAALGARRERLAAEIEGQTEVVEEVAVEAFMAGGSLGDFRYLVSVSEASDVAWRQYLVRNHAGSAEQALLKLRALRDEADDEVLDAIARAEELRVEIDALGHDLEELELAVPPLEELLPVADAWDRAVIAIEEGPYGIAPAEKWEKLRFCESTHDYRAVSESGRYRGAYQFDLPTWRTVGGTGDPIDAPPEEQDARARELYARRGQEPWPVCGIHLR